MLMASWKNYDKRAFSLTRVPGASRPSARAKSSRYQRIRPDSRSTKIKTSATAL
jgi:hypothetical protein